MSGRYLKLYSEPKKNWADARRTCQLEGGELVIVDFPIINEWLAKHAGGAAMPWLVHMYFKSARPALPFDTPVTGIGHRPVVPHHHHIKGGLGVVHCFASEKETV